MKFITYSYSSDKALKRYVNVSDIEGLDITEAPNKYDIIAIVGHKRYKIFPSVQSYKEAEVILEKIHQLILGKDPIRDLFPEYFI